jgi:phosphoribosyl-dephospho-CoA transferase
MSVAITVSALGGFKTFSSVNGTLATAISEVTDELETHRISMTNTQFVLTFDDTGQEYVFMAICKTGSIPNT